MDAKNSPLHADNSLVSLVVGALQEVGHVVVVIDHHRQTRRSARRGLLLQRFGYPASIICWVEARVDGHALVTSPPGQGLDHVVRAVCREQGARKPDTKGVEAVRLDTLRRHIGALEVLEVAVNSGVAQRRKRGTCRERREEERRLSALHALTRKCELELAQPPRRVGDIGLVQGEPDRVGSLDGAVLVRLRGGLMMALCRPFTNKDSCAGVGSA